MAAHVDVLRAAAVVELLRVLLLKLPESIIALDMGLFRDHIADSLFVLLPLLSIHRNALIRQSLDLLGFLTAIQAQLLLMLPKEAR